MYGSGMIKSRTTLVLGAGASAPYGFPIGSALRDMLLMHDAEFAQWIGGTGRDGQEWSGVQNLLHDFQPESIDDFLRVYPEHADLTKMAIARQLSKFENVKAHLNVSNGDPWYRILLDEVLDNRADLGGGALSIVTFNYDLSLEAYLVATLRVRHRMSEVAAIAALSALNIQHIYGDLGPTRLTHGRGREYSPFSTMADLQTAAQGISTCFEPKSRDAVAKAQLAIKESKNIRFLGFGYSNENLKRMNLPNCIRSDANIMGSMYECTGAAQRLDRALKPIPVATSWVNETSRQSIAVKLMRALFSGLT